MRNSVPCGGSGGEEGPGGEGVVVSLAPGGERSGPLGGGGGVTEGGGVWSGVRAAREVRAGPGETRREAARPPTTDRVPVGRRG